jgi:hypothetical protein
VLLIALWVRSYSTFDYAYGPFIGGKAFAANSINGRLSFSVHDPDWFPGARHWDWHSTPSSEMEREVSLASPNHFGFHFFLSSMGSSVTVPTWFAVAFAAALSAITVLPWKLRFTLRTLLIATTLVAVVLGLIVYAAR